VGGCGFDHFFFYYRFVSNTVPHSEEQTKTEVSQKMAAEDLGFKAEESNY
jgi:hypothetical protein